MKINRKVSLIFLIFTFNVSLCWQLQGLTDVRGNNAIREVRIFYTKLLNDQKGTYELIRGRPMFAEVDFVPRYIPQLTHDLALSVILPKQIRSTGTGGQWILGWHQEKFDITACRLCTNYNQSYTMPVTLFLPDDGWCAQGPVPTGWKVEALPKLSTESDNTDMIIGLSIDEQAQIKIVNAPDSSKCKNVNEYINWTLPVTL